MLPFNSNFFALALTVLPIYEFSEKITFSPKAYTS